MIKNNNNNNNNNTINTIIVGAGISGLVEALKCYENDEHFIILEANNRIGGRIHDIKWHNSNIGLGAKVHRPDDLKLLSLIEHLNTTYKDNNIINTTCFTSSYKGVDYDNNISIKNTILNNDQDLPFNTFYEIVKDKILYQSYYKSHYKYVIKPDVLNELFPVKPQEKCVSDYTQIINKICKIIGKKNIILKSPVKSVLYKKNNTFQIKTELREYTCNKLILTTNKIKTNIDKLTYLCKNIKSVPYLRIYTYHKNGHGFKENVLYEMTKTIIINDKILMAVYTEDKLAKKYKKQSARLNNNIIQRLFDINNIFFYGSIKIEQLLFDDIYISYWENGNHYVKYNVYNIYYTIKNEVMKNYNIILTGEVFNDSHGWTNGAL